MKIGTRIAAITVVLLVVALGISGFGSLRNRRDELDRDLERQTEEVGKAVSVALEAAFQEWGLFQDISHFLTRWQAVEPNIGFAYIDLLNSEPGRPPPGFSVADEPSKTGEEKKRVYV